MPGQSPYPKAQAGGGDAIEGFAKRFALVRKELGWSQRRAALAVDVTEQTIHNWERGHGFPSFAALYRLAEATGISSDWWLGLTKLRR